MDDEPKAKSACVIAGASPEQVAAVADGDRITMRKNALGTLVTGRLGSLPIDWAAGIPGPIYDVLYSRDTGWFSVTIFRDDTQPVRWDNRPGENAGYPRVDNIRGATTPDAILAALDIPPDAIGH